MTDRIRKLIESWKMEVIIMDGEEKIKSAAPSKRSLDENIEFVRENKAAIIAEIKAIEAKKSKREANIKAIEGLEEVKRIMNEWENYRYEENRRFETEDYRALAKPEVTVDELKIKYPRAAAYLTAQSWTRSNNFGKRNAGKKALERIIDGEDYEQVLADMDQEWSDYTKARMWD